CRRGAVFLGGEMKSATWVRKRRLAGVMLAWMGGNASAQNVIRLGLVSSFSGPFAEYGQQMLNGMKAYMKLHGDTVAGKKIEIIQRDDGGPAPEGAKRLAPELITRENLDILAGFCISP